MLEDDGYAQDQVKVFSHEGDGENTEHLKSMDLHDIKTELERDAEKAEVGRVDLVPVFVLSFLSLLFL